MQPSPSAAKPALRPERGLRSATTSYLLAMVHHAIRARLEAALKPVNVTPLQFTVLEVLAAHEGMTSADLSRRFYVTPQTMGEVVAHLVRRGLARREPLAADRRLVAIHATDDGMALLVEAEAALAAIEAEVFGSLNAAEHGALHGVLASLVQSLRRAPADLSAA
jgi:DNA-binding MarR family transcriptional regulator